MTLAAAAPPQPERKILVVDDDPTVRRLLEKLLAEIYTTYSAHSPEAAEVILAEHAIDVILCDHFMQNELGLEFLKRIGPVYPHTVKIMLTGCYEVETVMDAINQGHIFRYLTKPFTRKIIITTVEEALQEHDRLCNLDEITEQHREMSEQLSTWEFRFQRFKATTTRFLSQTIRFLALAIGVIFGFFLVVTVVGIGSLLILYALKSFLGFDTFEYFHLDDLIERLLYS